MLKHLLKKSIAAATSAAMVAVYFQCMPPIIHSHAEETITGETSDGFAYTIYPETSDVMITSYTGDHETVTSLVLPDKIEGYDVTVLGPWLFQDYPELSSVKLPSGLKKMHKRIFANAPKLKSLTLPKSLGIADSTTEYSIMDGVQGALSLSYIETLTFEDGIEAIPRDICYNAENLKSVVIPDSVKTIGQGAFSYCTSLGSVDIPDSVTLIESSAFANTTALDSIAIPSSVESMGAEVFVKSAISSIELSEGLTTMGSKVFLEAENLKEVTVPSTVTEATAAFTGSCVETVTFADGMTAIPYKICEDADHLSKINIPRSVTDLGDHSFAKTDGLQEFTLPKQITKADWSFSEGGPVTVHLEEGLVTIPEFTFGHATNTKSIDLADSVTTISKEAFTCAGLETVAIPDTVKYIGQSAFSSCESLTDLTLPTKGCELALWAFSKTKSLKSVYIPDGLFGDNYTYTFESSGLESITFAPTVTVIPEGICANCENLTEIKWSDAPKIIRQRAFDACTALKDAKLPDSITTIEHSAFYGTGLETLHIPESLTTLGDRAFMNTKSLKQLYVPFDIEKTEPAFMGSGIVKLEFADSIEYIRNTYQELPELTEVIIPESVKTIGAKAFYGDKSLSSIKLPSGLEEIQADAFAGTEELYSITIPKTVTKCGWSMFVGSRLTEITFEDGMEAIPTSFCRDAQSLATAHIPASVKKIGVAAFAGCRNLTTLDMPQDEISFANDTFYNCDVLFDERVDIYSRADTLINRIETSQGQNGLNNYTVYYKVNPRFEEKMTEGYIDIWVEDSNPIVCASLTEALRSSPDAETQTHLVAPFNSLDKEGVIRFSTRPKENANTTMTAIFKLKMENEFNDYYYEKSIPVSGEKLEKVSLKAPGAVQVKDGTVSFGMYGYAPADTEVVLFVNDNEVAKVFPSKYTGRYTANITTEAADGSEIKVYAMSGDTKSATQVLKCEEDVILVEKVMLYHDTTLTSYGLDITKIFTEGVTPFISYNPRKPIGFEVTLSDNNCMYVAVSSTVNEETSYMELEFDKESGTWKGEGYFATSVPGTLNIISLPNFKEQVITVEKDAEGNYSAITENGGLIYGGELSEEEKKIVEAFLKEYPAEFVVNDEKALAVSFTAEDRASDYAEHSSINYVQVTLDEVVFDGKSHTAQELIETEGMFTKLPVLIQEPDGTKSEIYTMMLTPNEYEMTNEIAENILFDNPPVGYLPGKLEAQAAKGKKPSTVGCFLDSCGSKLKEGTLTIKHNLVSSANDICAEMYSGTPDLLTGQGEDAAVSIGIETCIKKVYQQTAGNTAVAFNSVKTAVDSYHKLVYLQDSLDQARFSKDPQVREHIGMITAHCYNSFALRGIVTGGAVAGGITIAVVASAVAAPLALTLAVSAAFGFVVWGLNCILDAYDKKIHDWAYGVSNDGNLRYGIDPSGIAYEWLPSNPVEGATAEIYYKDDSGTAVKWNAEDYGQVNPLITDKGGRFAWDVPEGMWQVRVSAEGYEGAESVWLPVLPVQTGVDLKLTSKKPAEIADAGYGGGKVYVKFTRHMLDSSVTGDSLVLKDVGGTIVPCDVAPVKEEGNDTDTSILFALTPKESVVIATATVSVTSAALSYAKVPCADTAEKALRAMSDDEIPKAEESDYTLGDVNDDSKVDAKDASLILVEYSKASTGTESGFTESQKLAGEVNGDGKIDAKDASAILAYYAMASTATGDVPTLKEFVNPKSA